MRLYSKMGPLTEHAIDFGYVGESQRFLKNEGNSGSLVKGKKRTETSSG